MAYDQAEISRKAAFAIGMLWLAASPIFAWLLFQHGTAKKQSGSRWGWILLIACLLPLYPASQGLVMIVRTTFWGTASPPTWFSTAAKVYRLWNYVLHNSGLSRPGMYDFAWSEMGYYLGEHLGIHDGSPFSEWRGPDSDDPFS